MHECMDSWASTTNGFVYYISIFDALEQLSWKRGTVDTPIYTRQYSWSLVSVMINLDLL